VRVFRNWTLSYCINYTRSPLTIFSDIWMLQSCSERDPAQHPPLDGDAQLAVVEAVHASQAAADAGEGRGRDEEDGRELRGDEAGAGEADQEDERARGTERGAAAAEERHVRPAAGRRHDRLRPRGEDRAARQPEGRPGRGDQRTRVPTAGPRGRLRGTDEQTRQEE